MARQCRALGGDLLRLALGWHVASTANIILDVPELWTPPTNAHAVPVRIAAGACLEASHGHVRVDVTVANNSGHDYVH